MSEFFSLMGQVALVTGGGQGIGRAVVRRLHAAGARVAVFDADSDRARESSAEVGGLALVGDVRSESDVASAVEATTNAFGPLSVLVNNAGITGRTDLSWNLALS